MTVFMVERDLKGVSMADLGGAQQAAITTAQAMIAQGTKISYIRSTFAPQDGRCMCAARIPQYVPGLGIRENQFFPRRSRAGPGPFTK